MKSEIKLYFTLEDNENNRDIFFDTYLPKKFRIIGNGEDFIHYGKLPMKLRNSMKSNGIDIIELRYENVGYIGKNDIFSIEGLIARFSNGKNGEKVIRLYYTKNCNMFEGGKISDKIKQELLDRKIIGSECIWINTYGKVNKE